MSRENNNETLNKIKEDEKISEYKYEKSIFINPEKEPNWKYNYQTSYHFIQEIERIWPIIRSFDILSIYSDNNHYPIIFIKGEDSWTVGNEFKGNLFGFFPFAAKVNEILNLPEMKKIEWIFNLKKNDYFVIGFELFKVTEDNSTIAIKYIKYENNLFNEKNEKLYNIIIGNSIFEKVDELLEKEPFNLINSESCIINGKMEDIWNIITDFNKLTAIAPNNNYFPNINIRNLKIEEKIEATIFSNDEIKKCDIILKCKEDKIGSNKWLTVFEVSGGYPNKIPKNIVLFQLIKVNNNECQLTLLTNFEEPLENAEFKKISNSKKYTLASLKDYFDNFFSPISSN